MTYISNIKINNYESLEKFNEFVENNPYPEYYEMFELLLTHASEEDNSDVQRYLFTMLSKYGITNHKLIKTIYEHITDKDLITMNGKKIYKGGGEEIDDFYPLYIMPFLQE